MGKRKEESPHTQSCSLTHGCVTFGPNAQLSAATRPRLETESRAPGSKRIPLSVPLGITEYTGEFSNSLASSKKKQALISSVQNLLQDEIILGMANVTSGRFLKGCAMSRGNGITNK